MGSDPAKREAIERESPQIVVMLDAGGRKRGGAVVVVGVVVVDVVDPLPEPPPGTVVGPSVVEGPASLNGVVSTGSLRPS